MNLIVMAHNAEAQAFFKELKLTEQSQYCSHLYGNSDFYLLITGEGIQTTTERLSFVLGCLHGKISAVINLGIAGSLENFIEVDQIYPIRTCYQESQQKMAFKSYTTATSQTKVDLVTSNQRVLNRDYAQNLSNFAQIVDREAWAIGSVCYNFNLPWECFKYISDRAGKDLEICQRIKEKSLDFSYALFDYYFDNISKKEVLDQINEQNKDDLILPFDLYLTQTQKRQLQSIFKKLKNKGMNIEAILKSAEVDSIIDNKKRAKEKGKLLIDYLKAELSPLNTKIQNKIIKTLKPLSKNGISFHIDPSLESSDLKITYTIKGSKNIYDLQDALNQLDYKEYKNIFEGNIEI